jgi:hypothetical protein
MPRMPDTPEPANVDPPVLRVGSPREPEAIVCERCSSANVYRMHAVWRCADCGYKTDCCGW